jgi:hypothetical protein
LDCAILESVGILSDYRNIKWHGAHVLRKICIFIILFLISNVYEIVVLYKNVIDIFPKKSEKNFPEEIKFCPEDQQVLGLWKNLCRRINKIILDFFFLLFWTILKSFSTVFSQWNKILKHQIFNGDICFYFKYLNIILF